MTKIALLSDIHGNTTALEAVLEDSRKAKVDEYWLLGDSLMPGTGRRALLELLEELPITVKVLGTSSLGAIITVADTKGNVKGYVQNPGVDIKKTATGEVLVGPFVGNGEFLVITDYGTGNPYHSMTPLVTGEIGEDLAFYLTESQQTPCCSWTQCSFG